ncbi:D-xylose transporter [Fructilactobacillus sanfranciscensis]
MVTLGILLAYVSNLLFLHHNLLGIRDWRWMLGSALIPAVLLFIGGVLPPEYPRYLVEKGKVDEARDVLKVLRTTTGEDPEQEIKEIQTVTNQRQGGLKELFTVARSSVISAVGIMIFQQLVGINAVIYFLPQVFMKGFNFPAASAIWISVGIGIVNFVVTILAYLITDKVNRKTILIFGSIVMGVSLTALAIINFTLSISTASIPTMLLIAVYIFGFAISWGPIAWLLIGEIFPLSVRGIGTAIGSATNWVANFIVSQFFLTILALFHNNVGGPFAIFAVFSFLSWFFVAKFVPETRNKSLESIEETLVKNYNNKKDNK